jgi:magnesium chelatase subunit D
MRTPQSSQVRETRAAKARAVYPFSAIVAQEEMKLALTLNVVSSSIGGVLIMGHRGTGKSTVVRALADLLPEISVVSGCVYHCDLSDEQSLCGTCREAIDSGRRLRRAKSGVPVVDLPLGATEDRVCGTIDIEQALLSGVKRFEPGLLARANRGFLYIDEVNLLEDHLVDLLLDVAATGVNRVERESISIEHPARFVLIGSGNPEEGELRPQLLDRFGLYVEVTTEDDLERRVEIVERREAFERNPESFRGQFAADQDALRSNIVNARKSFANVKVERSLLRDIAQLCSDLKVDGHRGELTITRAARALTALEGRKKVTASEVKRVAVMSLRHRLRRDALEEAASAERIEHALDRVFPESVAGVRDDTSGGDGSSSGGGAARGSREPGRKRHENTRPNMPNGNLRSSPDGRHEGNIETRMAPAVESARPKLSFERDITKARSGSKLRSESSRETGIKRAVYVNERGRYARSVSSKSISPKIALDATLRSAAAVGFRAPAVGKTAGLPTDGRQLIPSSALRFKLFKRKQGRLFIFAIDLSGSMALHRIGHAKGMIHALLRESYIKRDSVAIVGFRGTSAELLLPPSRSILRARRVLDSVGVGGGTPLSAGLACALELAKRVWQGARDMFLLLITDGGANVPLQASEIRGRVRRREVIESEVKRLGAEIRKVGIEVVVISTQKVFNRNHEALALSQHLGARFLEARGSGESSSIRENGAKRSSDRNDPRTYTK